MIPTPWPAHPTCPPAPPGFRGGTPESLPPRGPGLGAHHWLRDCRETGLGAQNHVHLPLSDRVPVHAQGHDVGLCRAQRPWVGVHITATQQWEGGGGPIAIPSRGWKRQSHGHPSGGRGGRGGSTRPTHKLNAGV